MIEPADITTVCVVGTGAIGASWTTLLLDRGLRVVATDPVPGAEERLRNQLKAMQGGNEPAWDQLEFTVDLSEAARSSRLVIESGPERLELKREIFAALDRVTEPDVLLTSSSSGLLPSSFQTACARHPERVLVAHPFNPPHLVPLVEIVGGTATSADALGAAMETFRHLGKEPIHIRRELPGHVANRLQAALWREAYHLVEQGAVTVADIDTAISAGPGLRWALLGPLATQALSGGQGGLDHVLRHLGPPMLGWWEDLGTPHELSEHLLDLLVAGVEEELDGTSLAELAARRDAALVQLMRIKADHDLS